MQMIYTFYIDFICFLYTFYIHCIHSIYTLYILYVLPIHILHTFQTLFGTLFGHVPGKFGGRKKVFPKKFWGCLGCIWASSLVSKKGSRGSKKYVFFKKNNSNKKCSESPPDHFALIRKFIALLSCSFMHFLIFPIFQFFLYISL